MKKRSILDRKSKTQWEGISLHQKVADVNMKTKKVENMFKFMSCLKNVRDGKDSCFKNNCIIKNLIIALVRRGATL